MTDKARTPVIIDAVRTPVGTPGGALASVRADDIAAYVVRCLVERHPAAMEHLEDVYFGAANQSGEDSSNLARMAALLAGLPVEIPGVTVNRLSGSGLEAIVQSAKAVAVGEGSVYIAGGSEMTSRAPVVSPKSSHSEAGGGESFDTALGWRMVNPRMRELYSVEAPGESAENVAERHGISRADQDAWALASHERAAAAQDDGWFEDEIAPIDVASDPDGEPVRVVTDQGVRRDTSMAQLAALPPAFREGGTVTAGNSAPLGDGAAAVLVTSLARAEVLGLRPLARIVAWGHAGVHPSVMGIGPVPASRKALQRAGIAAHELEIVELNEVFAAQALASIQSLELDPSKVNPLGGAIALGHPPGCSGARVLTTLVHSLRRKRLRWGLATTCVDIGQGIACVVEGM